MVLLVVDTQKGIVDERLYAFEKFVSNIRKLIRTAREQGIEVVYVQHDDGPGTGFSIGDDEFEVYSGFAPLLTEKRFVKTVCSAFKKESGLLEYLTEKGEKDVMVCGIMTDFCINATVEAGFEHGLHMIVPAYANSTKDNEYMTGELEYLLRVSDEKDEERFRQLDETIRAYQKDGREEAAAAKVPFFKRKRFGRGAKKLKGER